MPQHAKDVQIANTYVDPPDASAEGFGYVRSGDKTAVPNRIAGMVMLAEPAANVALEIEVDAGARARVRRMMVTATDLRGTVGTSLLRRLPVDTLVRAVLEKATVKNIIDRPDFGPGAFQVPGDPDNQAWFSAPPAPTVKGKKVSSDRVERAAQVYLQALAAGSNAPAEVVAATLGYSRATAARDIRAARNRKPPLLPVPGEEAAFTPAPMGSGRYWVVPLTQWTGRTAAELAEIDERGRRETERLENLRAEQARQKAEEGRSHGRDGSPD